MGAFVIIAYSIPFSKPQGKRLQCKNVKNILGIQYKED